MVLRDRGASEPAGFCGTSQGAGWRSSSGVGGFCDTSQHAVAPVSGSRRPGCPDMRCLSGSAEVLFLWFCDANCNCKRWLEPGEKIDDDDDRDEDNDNDDDDDYCYCY